jgi:hypothetical protein
MMRKWIIGLGALVFAGCIAALAQVPGLYIASPTGLEQINVLVESTGTAVTNPQIQTVTINQVRNSSGHALVSTGTTVTSTPTNIVGNLIATGAITTWNVTLPNPAYDGEMFQVVNGTGSSFTSNVTVTAGTTPQNQVLAQSFASQSISAGAAAEWTFDLASLTWYRIR